MTRVPSVPWRRTPSPGWKVFAPPYVPESAAIAASSESRGDILPLSEALQAD